MMPTPWPPIAGIEPYYSDKYRVIYHADNRGLLPLLADVSAVVTDPPYELGFMGKSWDSKGVSFRKEMWQTISNACLLGAPLLSFGGSRTQHRIACAIEDAGWELRDVLMWVYGSGFPKSLDISKAIDKAGGLVREVIGRNPNYRDAGSNAEHHKRWNDAVLSPNVTAPASPESARWSGYGTALKPAYEPIILAMNPLDGTFASNALKHGVAGINIDECCIPVTENGGRPLREVHALRDDVAYHPNSLAGRVDGSLASSKAVGVTATGRFPANFLHDGSEEVLAEFAKAGNRQAGGFPKLGADSGSAARFFYTSKASRSERDAGLESLPEKLSSSMSGRRNPDDASWDTGNDVTSRFVTARRNTHPTVKPLALMAYLCKLVKMPEYNLILDPFCGSGTTLLACGSLGIRSVGIDSDEKSCEIAAARCQAQSIEMMKKGEY